MEKKLPISQMTVVDPKAQLSEEQVLLLDIFDNLQLNWRDILTDGDRRNVLQRMNQQMNRMRLYFDKINSRSPRRIFEEHYPDLDESPKN